MIFQVFLSWSQVAVEAVGIVSALKAGRVKGDRAMPAAPVYLDLENNVFFSRSFPCPSILGQNWISWPSLAAREARKRENIIEFG